MTHGYINIAEVRVDQGTSSQIGLGPVRNEDMAWRSSTSDPAGCLMSIWAVADGIGGNGGGLEASRAACLSLEAFYKRFGQQKNTWSTRDLGRRLEETMYLADRRIRLLALTDKRLAHMGTTLSCLLLANDSAIIAHVGDSRIYRLRKGHLSCLTTDHTFVQEMIFEGELKPEKAAVHPFRHMLTQAVGTQEPLDIVDLRIDPVRSGDCFLLSTDGLHNAIGEHGIRYRLDQKRSAIQISIDLVADAIGQGTSDNATAIVLKIN